MKDNNVLIYGIVAIVAILVFAGAAVAVGAFTAPAYDVSVNLSSNSSAMVYPYQATAFNLIVTNKGAREVVGLPVAFYVNGAQRNYSTYAIPGGGSINIPIVYTYLGSGGYVFTAVADPGNVINIKNRSMATKSLAIKSTLPQQADVYESVPNGNITYTDSFTTSGTGLFSATLMANLYNISALVGVGGFDGKALSGTYQDLYPYIGVANGAYSVYANGSASYAAWIQGTITPREIGVIISSFGKNVIGIGTGDSQIQYSALSNSVSLCSYYQGGWTKVVEFYNNSGRGTCLGFSINYTPYENNAISSALRSSRIGGFLASNQVNVSGQIPWSRFYYVNSTVLGQTVEYQGNEISASTLFQLQSPEGIFLSRIKQVGTDVATVNSTCLGLIAVVNGTSVCSVVLPTSTIISNQSYGAVYSRFISKNYTVELYSLIGESYLTLAHANAVELMSRLGIKESSVNWQSPFRNSCAFDSGFSCAFGSISTNGSISFTVTNMNYSSVRISNVTCAMGSGYPAVPLNGTLAMGQNMTITTHCSSLPLPGFAAQRSFQLRLGYVYHNVPAIVNGTLNVTSSG